MSAGPFCVPVCTRRPDLQRLKGAPGPLRVSADVTHRPQLGWFSFLSLAVRVLLKLHLIDKRGWGNIVDVP